jgi:hypothetical protein
MRSANATNVHRKSGVAKWRDLLFLFRLSHTPLEPGATPTLRRGIGMLESHLLPKWLFISVEDGGEHDCRS